MKKLLLIGSNSVHTFNYQELVKEYFDEVKLLTDKQKGPLQPLSPALVKFSIRNPLNIRGSIKGIEKVIEEFDPDVIHVQQAGTEAWLTLKANRKFNKTCVVTAWGSDVLQNPKLGKLYRNMLVYIINNADHMCCDSYFVSKEIKKYSRIEDHDIIIANFGIDALEKPAEKEKIIYSNRLHESLYNIDKIIRAFSDFLETDSDWKLIVAGKGSKTESLKKLVSDLGIDEKVIFPGWVSKEENLGYYRKSMIYISVPDSDGTSISLLEAMASDCIPLLSNLPANHEWVNDGLNGIICQNLKAESIQQALQLDYGLLKKINSIIIEKRATKEVNRQRFFELYDNILKS